MAAAGMAHARSSAIRRQRKRGRERKGIWKKRHSRERAIESRAEEHSKSPDEDDSWMFAWASPKAGERERESEGEAVAIHRSGGSSRSGLEKMGSTRGIEGRNHTKGGIDAIEMREVKQQRQQRRESQ